MRNFPPQSHKPLKAKAANKAIDRAGGPTQLADKLTVRLRLQGLLAESESIPVDRIFKWRQLGVPPEYIPDVSQISKMRKQDLDPLVYRTPHAVSLT